MLPTIAPTAPLLLQPTAPTAANLLRSLVPQGAVIEARVLSQTAALTTQAAYEVLLAIGSRSFKFSTKHPLAVGERVRLARTGEGQVQIVGHEAAPSKQELATRKVEALLDQALRAALPREQPIKSALQAMRQILDQPGAGVSEANTRLLREVFARLPDLAQVQNPQRLPEVLRLSGAFLEASLRQLATGTGRATPAQDVGAALLRLAANLQAQTNPAATTRSAPAATEARLLGLLQGVLAKVRVQQVNSLDAQVRPQVEAGAPRLSLVLPFLDGVQIETVQLTIGRESAKPDAESTAAETVWTVGLDFELGELGALHVQARLHRSQLATVFWAPQTDTLALVKRHIGTLRDELQRHDLHLQHVAYQAGHPPQRQTYPRPLLHVAI